MALDLAEALIKIARIIPENASPGMPLASFMVEAHDDDLRRRVRRLLELSDNKNAAGKPSLLKSRHSIWLYLGLVSSVVLLLASNKSLLFAIHNVSENVVAILQ